MLKINCQSCKKEIRSPLLAELTQTECPHCNQDVPVKDVIVCANGYSYYRTDLIKRLFRYKSLLAEAAKDYQRLQTNPDASQESRQSSKRFLDTLEEMLAGARDSVRIDFAEQLPVYFKSETMTGHGHLANLSMEGACLEVLESAQLPQNRRPIVLSFTLPGEASPLILSGDIAWLKSAPNGHSCPQIGINFAPQDQSVRATLWSFIAHATPKVAC